MDYLTIKDVTFQYPGASSPAISDFSLVVNQGDFVLLCGASGSGKSTLLKMLKPQLTPAGEEKGSIHFKGENLTDLPELVTTSKIGFVTQNPENQIVTENTWHELAFGLENLGLTSAEIKNRIAEMVNFLGIQELIGLKTTTLSGGQKQLLNLASVLVMKPDILLLDEPTTQLDPIAAQYFIDTLVRLNREMGMTIIMAEHRLEGIFASVDLIVLLEEGRLLLNEKPANVAAQIRKRQTELERFVVSLPSAVQLYLSNQIDNQCPMTVLEGKRFLTKHFGKPKQPFLINQTIAEQHTANISIQLKDCWFRYDKQGKDILAGITAAFRKGEICSLVGGNGTGKTTLLKAIAGINKCYFGKITILDKPLKKNRQALAFLPQESQMLFIKDSIQEDYQNYLQNKGMAIQEQQSRIKKVVTFLGIERLLIRHPLDLSGGECQLAALGKLLLIEPEILLLDEPTKGIDNYGKKKLIQLLKTLSSQGKTIIIVTHDLDFAAESSDRCGLFFDNNLLTITDVSTFFSNHMFYTTAASRMSRELISNVVTTAQLLDVCRELEGF